MCIFSVVTACPKISFAYRLWSFHVDILCLLWILISSECYLFFWRRMTSWYFIKTPNHNYMWKWNHLIESSKLYMYKIWRGQRKEKKGVARRGGLKVNSGFTKSQITLDRPGQVKELGHYKFEDLVHIYVVGCTREEQCPFHCLRICSCLHIYVLYTINYQYIYIYMIKIKGKFLASKRNFQWHFVGKRFMVRISCQLSVHIYPNHKRYSTVWAQL